MILAIAPFVVFRCVTALQVGNPLFSLKSSTTDSQVSYLGTFPRPPPVELLLLPLLLCPEAAMCCVHTVAAALNDL